MVFFIIKNKKVAVLFDNGDLTGLSNYEIGDLIEIDGTKISLSDKMNNHKFSKEGLRLTEKYFFPRRKIEIMFNHLNEL